MCGATSGAGKSTVAAGLCRSLARSGRRVAPFKAQNMSNHAAVAVDGGEVGRAQAMQADAAGIDVERVMNPILLKPAPGGCSHVVVLGDEVGTTDAVGWGTKADELRDVVLRSYEELRRRFDVVVAEGAGGAAEINLLDRDLVNLPLAAATGTPAILVVDIERGGAFAAAHGTIDLLPDQLRSMVGGIVFNRFRGDPSLLTPGIDDLTGRTGVPVLGVLPHLGPRSLLGVEDSMDVGGVAAGAARSEDPVRVVGVRLPHLANPSDLDPFLIEPDVELAWATRPGQLDGADVIIVPGSRATVADLSWVRRTGIADVLSSTEACVVGICAGQQMLGATIEDDVESAAGVEEALGLVDVRTTFEREKVVRRRRGRGPDGLPVDGYQIHLGRARADGEPWLMLDDDHGTEPDGCIAAGGRVRTTSLHGIFDDDAFRRRHLEDVADRRGRTYGHPTMPYRDQLRAQHDRLADWLEEHLDMEAVDALVATATPAGRGPGW